LEEKIYWRKKEDMLEENIRRYIGENRKIYLRRRKEDILDEYKKIYQKLR